MLLCLFVEVGIGEDKNAFTAWIGDDLQLPNRFRSYEAQSLRNKPQQIDSAVSNMAEFADVCQWARMAGDLADGDGKIGKLLGVLGRGSAKHLVSAARDTLDYQQA